MPQRIYKIATDDAVACISTIIGDAVAWVALVYIVSLFRVSISTFIVNFKSSTSIYATVGDDLGWDEIWDGLGNEKY